MEFFRRATVALANTPLDTDLLRYARLIHEISEGEMTFFFLHVLATGPDTKGAVVTSHREALASIRASVEQHFQPGASDTCRVVSGSPVDKLLEFAAESRSDVLLLGHHRNRSGRRSLGRRLAMKAPCSLWMVPEGSPVRMRRILAAVDFSIASAHALSFATLLASRLGASECLAVHVRPPTVLSGDSSVDQVVRTEDRKAFETFLSPLDLHAVKVRPQTEDSGSVTAAILRAAEADNADLVVMGTRGRSASTAVLLGSESEQMLIETTRPVLVTKQRGERIGLLQVLLDRDFQTQDEPRFG
jgi:nucleotide-binding universal stress UspA family protein